MVVSKKHKKYIEQIANTSQAARANSEGFTSNLSNENR